MFIGDLPFQNGFLDRIFNDPDLPGGFQVEGAHDFFPAYRRLEIPDAVPFLHIHGQNDETVDVQSARNLLDALTAAGREVTYAERPKTHASLLSDDLTWALIDVFLADRLLPDH